MLEEHLQVRASGVTWGEQRPHGEGLLAAGRPLEAPAEALRARLPLVRPKKPQEQRTHINHCVMGQTTPGMQFPTK